MLSLLIATIVALSCHALAQDDNTTLPDGTEFRSWETPPVYTRTYHVAAQHPQASDDGPGTADAPWKTINRAAQVLQPGERVIVHGGVYREWVKPVRGGDGPDRMIAYEAAPGEEVVITGSDLWSPQWQPTRDYSLPGGVVTWCARLTGSMFEGANPFCLQNFMLQPDPNWPRQPGFELRRGQLFLDGQPLTQVNDYPLLATSENAFWVEDNGMTIHLRLAGDESPVGKTFEITTREQVFAPLERGLSYIRLSGFRIRHAGNGIPIPAPQRGAISATAGTHWIIEDCEVAHANTIGIDLGGQWWTLRGKGVQGWHIVRRCHIHHCGISGISAWHNVPNQSLLIEDNLITDNGSLPCTSHFETGGIKLHCTLNSLIRRNVFLRNAHSAALWLDGEITNTRITQNLFADTTASPFGSVFLEINNGPNLVDNNIILRSHSHGIYEHDAARILVLQNLIADGDGSAVFLNRGDPNRKMDGVHPEDHHRVMGNLLAGFHRYIVIPNETSHSDFNVLGGCRPGGPEPFATAAQAYADLTAWREAGNDTNSLELPLEVTFDETTLELSVRAHGLAALPDFPAITQLIPDLPAFAALIGSWRAPQVPDRDIQPRVAPTGQLLRADLLGRPRPRDRLQIGPLVNLPLDGTPLPVDPRRR